jgi:hypothetical protein
MMKVSQFFKLFPVLITVNQGRKKSSKPAAARIEVRTVSYEFSSFFILINEISLYRNAKMRYYIEQNIDSFPSHYCVFHNVASNPLKLIVSFSEYGVENTNDTTIWRLQCAPRLYSKG